MTKRLVVVFITLVLLTSPLFALDEEEITNALTPFLDCVSASVLCNYVQKSFALPSSAITVYGDSNLPARISYFLADPAEFKETMELNLKSSGYDFFINLFSRISKSKDNELLNEIYNTLASKDYKLSDFIVNGWISFDYPEQITGDELMSIWLNRTETPGSIGVKIDVTLLGNKLENPVSVQGYFTLAVNSEHKIEIASVGEYSINGVEYYDGSFSF